MPLKLAASKTTQATAAPTISSLPPILSEEQAAAYLVIPVKKLRRIRYDGKGPPTHKIGNQHRIRREDFLAWIENCRTEQD